MRSTIVPSIGLRNNPGIAVSATTAPAIAADPVISRANQGSAIKTMEPAITLVILDSSTKMYEAMPRLLLNL
ncbi:unannotated protein [freshwater metagenome]|uniref:Unannotated protein n=1 Tax=freshwater metagenome TaxID=449393 RepID=A0A6J6DV44_9ZZZZ